MRFAGTSHWSPGSADLTPASINYSGEIAGRYAGAGGRLHGFVRDAAGNFTQLDAPGATQAIGANGKIIGISDTGVFRLNRAGGKLN